MTAGFQDALDRINAGDLEGALEFVHPEVVWHPPAGAMGETTFRGHEGVRDFTREWLEAWGKFEQTVLEMDFDGEWAVARVALETRGETSGVELGAESGYVMRFRDGKLAYMRICTSYEEALAVRAQEAAQ